MSEKVLSKEIPLSERQIGSHEASMPPPVDLTPEESIHDLLVDQGEVDQTADAIESQGFNSSRNESDLNSLEPYQAHNIITREAFLNMIKTRRHLNVHSRTSSETQPTSSHAKVEPTNEIYEA